jgi:long-chain acyl-CoA synthetase
MTDGPGVHCGSASRSYADLGGRAMRIAGGLQALGVSPGDRIAIFLRNDIPFLEASAAAGILGVSPVPVNWHWKDDELNYLLVDSSSKVVFAHSDLVPVVEAALPAGVQIIEVPVSDELAAAYNVSADAAKATGRHQEFEAFIAASEPLAERATSAPLGVIYTSGTTGRPKGILRERMDPEKQLAGALAVMKRLGFDPSMKTMVPAPMYHTAPNVHALAAVSLGMDLTALLKFDPEDFLRTIEANQVDHIQMVPTMFVRLLKLPEAVRRKYDLSSLKNVVHAAAPCPPDVKRAMIEWWGPIITEYYGGSETGIAVWCDSEEWLAHPGTVGRAVDGADIRILDDNDEILPAGEVGRVFIKPMDNWPNFTYIGDDEKRRKMELDGYLTVGDVGRLDEDGFLYLSDRANDMVISGGVNIYPAEIEAALIGLEGVRDVAVFGIPDEDFGEALAAHIDAEPEAGLTQDAVRDFVRQKLANYKVPKVVVFDSNLPREDSGKLFKRKLREPYWSGRDRHIN